MFALYSNFKQAINTYINLRDCENSAFGFWGVRFSLCDDVGARAVILKTSHDLRLLNLLIWIDDHVLGYATRWHTKILWSRHLGHTSFLVSVNC
jgi:hypothetical protein